MRIRVADYRETCFDVAIPIIILMSEETETVMKLGLSWGGGGSDAAKSYFVPTLWTFKN